jgi:hypothetical protein
MRMTDAPMVNCEALLELRVLVRSARDGDDVIEGHIIHRTVKEMLMSRSPRYRHADQLKLFHPAQSTPQWQTLPPTVRQSATKLLALMLCEHAVGGLVAGDARRASR